MAKPLKDLSETPETACAPAASFDVLSNVLCVVRLSGAVLFRGDFSAPWAIETPPPAELAGMLLPGARQLLMFHLIAEGHCWIRLGEAPPVRLETGDIALFPYGDEHTMGSDPAIEPASCAGLLAAARRTQCPVIAHGGGGRRASVVCGFLHCDEMLFNPLLRGLPPLIHVRTAGEPAMSPTATAMRRMVAETNSRQPGAGCLLARLSELLFVEVLRHHMARLAPGAAGWLGALNDPMVGHALQLIHEAPADDWTVERLARRVGASRSVFSDRFKRLLGQPPMHYLTAWRVQLAAGMLQQNGENGLAAVAQCVGYDSEAAFNRAFRRQVGVPPAAWRAKNFARACSAMP